MKKIALVIIRLIGEIHHFPIYSISRSDYHFTASFSLLHVFPPTDVYYDTMEYDETQFVFNFDDTGKDANSHLKNVYLTSNELNIFNKKLYANDGNNYSYYINVPKNVTHFQLDVTFEAEFPYISQHIIIDVERV